MNSFGTKLKFTSFGESHGKAVGCVLDGMPAGIKFDEEFLRQEMEKRRGGSRFSTSRKESDSVELLSGIFEGKTTGQPIAMVIFNENTRSKDYEEIKTIFRPSHADFSYFMKFGLRDYRGGGRSSARESAARVAAGAVAAMLLKECGIEVESGIFGVGACISSLKNEEFDFDFATQSEIFALDRKLEEAFKDEILQAKKEKDSVGAAVFTRVSGVMAGLGEVLYDKLDSKLAHAIIGINAVKAFEIGSGMALSKMRGSEANDKMCDGKFLSNHSGGILGGISNGNLIELKSYFKPTPSIFLPQESMNEAGENVLCELKGRHDPCVGVRGSVVITAMTRLVMADALLSNLGSKLSHLREFYNK